MIARVLIAIVIAVTQVHPSLLATQTWEWDAVPGAASYRIYWGASGRVWCSTSHADVPAKCQANRCQGDVPLPRWTPMFINIAAINAAGEESPPDHGDIINCYR